VKEKLKEKVADIVNGKLTSEQIEELIGFFRQALSNNLDTEDESFFRNLAYEVSGDLRELALMLVDFRKDLKSRICPEITDLAIKHIPQATDQLEGIIETTEIAANKIMDNLESMQGYTEKMGAVFSTLKCGEIALPGAARTPLKNQTVQAIDPVISYMESGINAYMGLISDSFVQMSFQDLTGQRIKRIMALVGQMEQKLTRMIISFGIQLTEHGKNPDVSKQEMQKAVDEKVVELAGPQRTGQGLGQAAIDDLLMNL